MIVFPIVAKEKWISEIRDGFDNHAVHISNHVHHNSTQPIKGLHTFFFLPNSQFPFISFLFLNVELVLDWSQVLNVGPRVRDHHDCMWVLWGCQTRSVSSEHRYPLSFSDRGLWPCYPERSEHCMEGSQPLRWTRRTLARLWVTINAAQNINQPERWVRQVGDLGNLWGVVGLGNKKNIKREMCWLDRKD